ncbi:hypothetical protein T484DRAFT_1787217 [Baffinella frigidus]|nr:hypothetical protein T484DRAFT_1787217 [Cryptophyta sp. CCMP2293]
MAAGNDHNWMVVGTSRGFHILYDLRFQLDVQCWRHPGATEVYDMQLCNAHGLEQVWDVSRGVCLVHLAATSRTHVADMSNIEVRIPPPSP